MFHAQKLEKVGESIPTYDKIQNLIFTDIESIVELENSVAVQGFDTVKVTVNDPKDIEKIIAGRDRKAAGDCVPAKGLKLVEVYY